MTIILSMRMCAAVAAGAAAAYFCLVLIFNRLCYQHECVHDDGV